MKIDHSGLGKTATGRSRRFAGGLTALTAAACAGAAAVAFPAVASASVASHALNARLSKTTVTYAFTKLGDAADPTFNQLLGINDLGVIAGYFGSGTPAATHPNKGYTIAPYAARAFSNENFPGAQQTQVIGLNDMGKTVGFYVTAAGANIGFFAKHGKFTSVTAPGSSASPAITQLLGVNNEGMSVGFFNDASGNAHAFRYNTKTGAFSTIAIPGAVSATATGINDEGQVSGFFTTAAKVTESFVSSNGVLQILQVPGATQTQAFGINDLGQVVGQFTAANGKAHGFVYTRHVFRTVDDPAGVGSTTINGINNAGAIVGFYTDKAGNTDGFVGQPVYFNPAG